MALNPNGLSTTRAASSPLQTANRNETAAYAALSPRTTTATAAVKKGDLVMIKVLSKNMELSAQGRSLDNGAVGDVVRVSNTMSKKVVEGKVTSPQLVEIMVLP
jgi:flagella basal body P-ring formation protein FlgA